MQKKKSRSQSLVLSPIVPFKTINSLNQSSSSSPPKLSKSVCFIEEEEEEEEKEEEQEETTAFTDTSLSAACKERPSTPISKPNPRMSSEVVEGVLKTCTFFDSGAELASATFNAEKDTIVRIRSSMTCSVYALQDTLVKTMPLCNCEIHENALDGVVEVGIVVFSVEREKKLARKLARSNTISRSIGMIGFFLFFVGFVSWIGILLEKAVFFDRTEL